MQDKKKMKMLIIILLVIVLLVLAVGIRKIWSASRPVPVPTTDAALTEFSYSHSGSMVDEIYSYEIKSDESSPTGFTVIFNLRCGYEVYSTSADAGLIQAVVDLIEECELHKWNGFNETDSMVMDGSGFSLKIAYVDGTEVYAHGSNSFPANYGESADKIDMLFEAYMEANRSRLVEITDEWHS